MSAHSGPFQPVPPASSAALVAVDLPGPFPDSLPYTEYGDGPGMLGGQQAGGSQALPRGLGAFLQEKQVGPDLVFLTVYGDTDMLWARAAGGHDSLSGFAGVGLLFGDAGLMLDDARGGRDVFRPAGNVLAVFGDAGIMADRARGGHDDLLGARGTAGRGNAINDLHGDAWLLAGQAAGGNDRVTGGGTYPGTTNRLYGDGHVLADEARAGNDTLVSGANAHNDMWGDAALIAGDRVTTGRDVLVILSGSQANRIHDFEPGKDRIDMTDYADQGIHGFADLQPKIQLTEAGSFIFFGRSGGGPTSPVIEHTLTVVGQFELKAEHFLFG